MRYLYLKPAWSLPIAILMALLFHRVVATRVLFKGAVIRSVSNSAKTRRRRIYLLPTYTTSNPPTIRDRAYAEASYEAQDPFHLVLEENS